MRTLRTIALLGVTAAAAAPLAAQQPTTEQLLERCQRGQGRQSSVRHCEVAEHRLPAGSLRLEASNGAVTVVPWDGREVLVRSIVEGRAASAGRARELVQGVRIRTDGTVRATGRNAPHGENWSVSYHVLVPAHTDLDLRTSNGPMSVARVSGTHRLRTENGPLVLDRLAGDVQANAQNGPITVTLEGARWSGAGLAVETVNGPVTVRMPRDYAARVEGGTTNGPIRTDLPVTTSGRGWGRRTIEAEIGGGGPTLRFTTVNGPLTISRS